jgi:hypothetical protein
LDSLSVNRVNASGLKASDYVAGCHRFNPRFREKLAEVVTTDDLSGVANLIILAYTPPVLFKRAKYPFVQGLRQVCGVGGQSKNDYPHFCSEIYCIWAIVGGVTV